MAGAINFVKELEQLLQSLESQKRRRSGLPAPAPPPFARFFTFPQYSASGGNGNGSENGVARRGVADVEVAVAESHASVKLLAPRRRPNSKQLLRMVLAMRCLGLTVLHLNATAAAADHLVFYSFSLKVSNSANPRLSISVSEFQTRTYMHES